MDSPEQPFPSLLLIHPIPRLGVAVLKLPDHFAFVERKSAFAGGAVKKIAVVGHVELRSEFDIPRPFDFLAQQRVAEHFLRDLDVERRFEFHDREGAGRKPLDERDGKAHLQLLIVKQSG